MFVKKRLTPYRRGDSLELNLKGGFDMVSTMTALFILAALMVSSLVIANGGAEITWL